MLAQVLEMTAPRIDCSKPFVGLKTLAGLRTTLSCSLATGPAPIDRLSLAGGFLPLAPARGGSTGA
jgi:hypothetical protein